MTAETSSTPCVLITGGSGFVGKHLIRFLKPHTSRIVVLSTGTSIEPEHEVEYREVDVRQLGAVRAIVNETNPQHVYHLAGITAVDTSWTDPRLTFEVNVLGALNVFEAAMQLPSPSRILNVSTSQVYAPSDQPLTEESVIRPDSPYAASKAMAELLTVQYRKAPSGGIISARPFNHTGPGQSPNFVLSSIAKQFA
jgi:GDP-4-dehydro-6-deoxy-D-mannose reductase